MTIAAAALALAAISAVGTIAGGQAQAKMANAQAGAAQQAAQAQAKASLRQATMQRMQGRSEVLKYREEGVRTLENVLRNISTVNARAGAGGIDPFSGSAQALNNYALGTASDEYGVSLDNAIITLRSNELQAGVFEENAQLQLDRGAQEAALLRYQGKVAKTQSYFKAATTMASAGMSYAQIGGPPAGDTSGVSQMGGTWQGNF
jgi:hypothetical protein